MSLAQLEHRLVEADGKIRELMTENEKLARAVASAPTPLEERKVVALEKIAEALTGLDGHDVFTQLREIAYAIGREK